MTSDNGSNETADRVAFGDGATDSIPVEWAERMLRNWRRAQPGRFGAALAEAATGAPVSARRSRRKPSEEA